MLKGTIALILFFDWDLLLFSCSGSSLEAKIMQKRRVELYQLNETTFQQQPNSDTRLLLNQPQYMENIEFFLMSLDFSMNGKFFYRTIE